MDESFLFLGGIMYVSGERIYFRHGEGSRALKGEVIGHVDGLYQIKGARRATQHARPVYLIPAEQVFPVGQIKRKPSTHKLQGSGLSINTAESLERKAITESRLNMTEGSVLFSDPMQQLCRQIVRRLASFNGIYGNNNPELHELGGEFLVSALQAIRTATSKASEADLENFRLFLKGQTVTSKIMLTVARTGKTACIRFLKRRQQYHMVHVNFDALERREAA